MLKRANFHDTLRTSGFCPAATLHDISRLSCLPLQRSLENTWCRRSLFCSERWNTRELGVPPATEAHGAKNTRWGC